MALKILFVNEYSVRDTLRSMASTGDNSAHLWGFDYLSLKEEVQFVNNSHRLLTWQKKLHLDAMMGGLYEEIGLLSRRRWADVIVAANINLVWGLSHLRGCFRIPPIVAILHSLPAGSGSLYRSFMSHHLSGIDRILCIAKKDHDYLTRTLGLESRRVLYTPWSVNPDDFDRALQTATPPKPGRRKYVLSIGKTQRDYKTLIRAFGDTRRPELDLRIFGAGRIRSVDGIDVRVSVHEQFVPFNECVKEYRDATLVVIPLVGSRRTLGLTSLYDAMAMGKAFVMTKNPGVDIDIEREKAGLWAEPGNAEDLKSKILYFLDHPEFALEYGANGRKYLREKYNYGHFCAKLHEVVQEVCALRGR